LGNNALTQWRERLHSAAGSAQWKLRMPLRRIGLVLATLAAAAILAFLYQKTQSVDLKQRNEVLRAFRELKEIDVRWDVEALRLRAQPLADTAHAVAAPAMDPGKPLNALRAATTAMHSTALDQGLAELQKAFSAKAEQMDRFRKGNMAAASALREVLQSDTEMAGLIRGSWQEFPQRERLVALENLVSQLLASAPKYYYLPGPAQREAVETHATDLREASAPMPPALREGVSRLDQKVEALLQAKPAEEALYARLAFMTAGPRVDNLTNTFNSELEEVLSERELYRAYLLAYSAALLILIGYLAMRLGASYRLLNDANRALHAANESLEHRVTERTRELSEAMHQLKESEATLIQTEKMSSLGQMVAGVAHEINTPLAYVKNSLGAVGGKLPELQQLVADSEQLLGMLRAGNADPQQLAAVFGKVHKLVSHLKEHQVLDDLGTLVKDGLYGIEQISDIVVNLRNFSRLDRSKVANFNLNEGIESALILAKHELKKHTVQKEYGDLPLISCSPSQINQVFLNLVNNASQAIAADKGVITVRSRPDGDSHVVVEVEDNGKGIPPEILPRIFDPFFTTKDVGKGTGLGLSISYKIIEQHGGTIKVDSTVGVGTRFTVRLPLKPPTEETA